MARVGLVGGARAANSKRPAATAKSPLLLEKQAPRAEFNLLAAAANIARFFGGLLGWIARHPVLAIGIVLLLAFMLLARDVRLPFLESREHAIARADRAEAEVRAQREIGEASREITNRWVAARASIERDLERGREAVESVSHDAPAVDFLREYARADRRLLDSGNAPA